MNIINIRKCAGQQRGETFMSSNQGQFKKEQPFLKGIACYVNEKH